MQIRVVALNKEISKIIKVPIGSIFNVIEVKIKRSGRKYPTESKQYIVSNPNSYTKRTMFYWYEVEEINH